MNFDQLTDRFNSDACKWNVKENELPMWIADMDFEAAPEIIEALQNRLNHKIFGYTEMEDQLYESYIYWWKEYHNFEMNKDWLLFSTGVVPSISSLVRKLTTPAEKVLIMAPVYNIFYNSILNNGRVVLSSDLIYENGEYHIDFSDLESKMKDPQTTLMILCNPHNPIGKIWDKATLEKIGQLAYENNVVVISDEIHCDITKPGCNYIPFASINEINRINSITCIAPTKAFNLAGLSTSMICVPNPTLRHKVWRGINTDEIAEASTFATVAPIAAFTKCRYWNLEMRNYIWKNHEYCEAFIQKELPMLHLVSQDATYLLWIDCSKVCSNSKDLADFIREKTGLFVNNGLSYGETGKTFIRVNVATQMSRVIDGMNRLKEGIIQYINK